MGRRACSDCARTTGVAMRVLVSSNILCAICLLVFGCTVRALLLQEPSIQQKDIIQHLHHAQELC